MIFGRSICCPEITMYGTFKVSNSLILSLTYLSSLARTKKNKFIKIPQEI